MRTGAAVTAHRCDVLDEDGGVSLLDTLDPLPEVAVCVVGLFGEAESRRDSAAAERVMRTNYAGPALLMGVLAERFDWIGIRPKPSRVGPSGSLLVKRHPVRSRTGSRG